MPALGFHACPCDGKAEKLTAEGGGGGDVLFVTVPEIGGAPARGESLASFPKIPDILTERIVCLDLVVCVGGTEEEVLGELKFQNSNDKEERATSGS